MEERLLQAVYAEYGWVGANWGGDKEPGNLSLLTTNQKHVENGGWITSRSVSDAPPLSQKRHPSFWRIG